MGVNSKGTLFPKKYNMTVGIDLMVNPISIEGTTRVVELITYDVGGQDIFIDCSEEHISDTNYVMLVFNVNDEKSFADCQNWLNLVLKPRKQTAEPLSGVVIGNKTDLSGPNRIHSDAASEWARSKGLEYFEVSA